VRHILVSSKDIYINHLHKESVDKIRNKINSIKQREHEFDNMFYEQRQKLTNDFDKIVQRIKVIKNEYNMKISSKDREYNNIKRSVKGKGV
jgi:hypothetical protein